MAKLTLSFRDLHLATHLLDEQPCTIGRDRDCRIYIDSLAVAPRHAEITPKDDSYLLLALDPDYPVRLNGEQVDQASLSHGDLIQVGKHSLVFWGDTLGDSRKNSVAAVETRAGAEDAKQAEIATDSMPAYIQIQSGREIGRVVVIQRALTRLMRAGAESLVISREGGCYRMKCLDAQALVRIDGRALRMGELETELHDGNLVEVDDMRFQFFFGTGRKPPLATDGSA